MSLFDYKGNEIPANGSGFSPDFKNCKVICIGDSLTEGDYGSEPEGTANLKAETYPYFLNKYFGVSVTNAGVCGFTATSYFNYTLGSQDFSDKDIAIIMLGTNGAGMSDTLDADTAASHYTGYANTDTGNYCKIIEYIIEQNPDVKILLCTCPYVDATRRSSYAAAVANSNVVIPKIADKYNLPVLDVNNELGVNDENTRIMQPIDGLHGGVKFYERLATYIGGRLMALFWSTMSK